MRKKIMAFVLAATCMMCTIVGNVGVQAAEIHEAALEDYIMEEMSSANILGMGISIVNAEKELYCVAYGSAYETGSDYVLGSVSKSLTAAGIMRMAEDEELYLEDTVSTYLPKYTGVADVTIQELLSHTSGITAEQTMSDLKVSGKKGEFEFANANYNLLGEIIEEISGLSYEEYISDNILDPLEMTSTYSLRTGSDLSEELLNGYQNFFGFPLASTYEYNTEDDWMQVPSSYMISDIKDMGKYLQMYLRDSNEVLSQESIDAMLRQETVVSSDSVVAKALFDGGAKYGIAWAEKEVEGTAIYYQAGQVEDFTTMLVLLPEQELGIVMMFNSADYPLGQKMIQTLEEGIVSIEIGQEPVITESNVYLIQHGVIDVTVLLAILAAWMPIFLMGVWCRKRRNHLLSVLGIIVDAVIHIVLPVVIYLIASGYAPEFMVKRFLPDLYYAVWAVILSLCLGGVLKIVAGIVLAILGPKEETPEEEDEEEDEVEAEQPTKTESKGEVREETGVSEKESETGDKEQPVEQEAQAEIEEETAEVKSEIEAEVEAAEAESEEEVEEEIEESENQDNAEEGSDEVERQADAEKGLDEVERQADTEKGPDEVECQDETKGEAEEAENQDGTKEETTEVESKEETEEKTEQKTEEAPKKIEKPATPERSNNSASNVGKKKKKRKNRNNSGKKPQTRR